MAWTKNMNRLDRYIERQMQDPEIRDLVEKEVAALEVGIQIARLREGLKINQTQLAARAGMNASKISKIKCSPKTVTPTTLTRLPLPLTGNINLDFIPFL